MKLLVAHMAVGFLLCFFWLQRHFFIVNVFDWLFFSFFYPALVVARLVDKFSSK